MFQKFFKKSNLNQDDNWISFIRNSGNEFFSIRLNYGFSDFFPVKGYDELAIFSLELKNISKEDKDLIYRVEDKVSEVLENYLDAFFIGVIKDDLKFNLYFYLKNFERLNETVDKAMMQFPSLNFSLSFEKDRKWKNYENILPTSFEYEKSMNKIRLFDFQKNGGKIGKKVEVFYFISFKSEKFFTFAKDEIKNLGFQIIGKGEGKRKGFKYAVKLFKNMKLSLNDLDKNTYNLCFLEDKYNFKYEGLVLK